MTASQHPPVEHFILHISDTHFVGGADLLHGKVDSDANLKRLFRDFAETKARPEAIVFTGDLADTGDADAYRRLRALVEPAAEAIGAQVIWVMGNHDTRTPFRKHLLDSDEGEKSVDMVYDVNGLRVIALDSTVPGSHHGEISEEQYAWLAEVLSTPAPHGSVIALHHPPVPSLLEPIEVVELRDQARFAEALRGTDVRAVLGGHLHFNTFSDIGGVPVSVASATCYTQDLNVESGGMRGQDGAQGFNLVHFYDDRVMHTVVPIGEFSTVYRITAEQLRSWTALSLEEVGAEMAMTAVESEPALA
ncbi:metallophosphoesterase [Leucobacter tenebrionis]|uniref:metallophosphoesterase n=1 Tax=Leucobacter tenebrionis TaxID=2873270 RepID=UPI001CA64F04|nr:metallophosphoesterase [Leucobacter tenebrionis]QZY50580.1 metallophosphoesterase [Leucobacter tenebrionis]